MLTGQTNFLYSLGWALLNSLWQMALLWILFLGINGLIKNSKSSFRSSLASIFLVSGFVLFLATFLSFYYFNFSSGPVQLTSSLLSVENNSELNDWLFRVLPVASVSYLLVLLIPVSHFIRNYRYVHIIRQHGLAKADVQWKIFIKKMADRLGIKKPVHIWVSEFVSSPVTIGFLKPVILIPIAAINNLSIQQMEAVLLHELTHIRRYDYLVNLVINLIHTILYFNPFVKAFVKIVEKEREKSCDEMVLQFQYDSYEYASALLILEKSIHKNRLLTVGAIGHKNDLFKGVELIMGIKPKKFFSFKKFAGFFAGLFCIACFNVFLFNQKPTELRPGKIIASNSYSFPFSSINYSNSKNNPELITQRSETKSTNDPVALQMPEDKTTEKTTPRSGLIPGIINVGYYPSENPELTKYQQAQVKAAIDASKKVLENEKWKLLENNIADVLTRKEKDELKVTYKNVFDKINWDKWENKLALAYNNVDWNRVNDQLAKAINNIRIDSLEKVYTDLLLNLEQTRQELLQNDLSGIPDSDITLLSIDEKVQLVQNALNKLNSLRSRKVVHL